MITLGGFLLVNHAAFADCTSQLVCGQPKRLVRWELQRKEELL